MLPLPWKQWRLPPYQCRRLNPRWITYPSFLTPQEQSFYYHLRLSRVPHVATDDSQEPEGSPSPSDSASGTAVTSISSSESVPSVPPSNSNEGSTDLSPTSAAQGGASNPDTNSGANTSANTANPSSRPRAVNLHLSKICRACALEVFYWGAKQWWIKERANAHTEGTLPRVVRDRKDCPDMFQYVKKEGEEGDGELVVGVCSQEDDHCKSKDRPPISRLLTCICFLFFKAHARECRSLASITYIDHFLTATFSSQSHSSPTRVGASSANAAYTRTTSRERRKYTRSTNEYFSRRPRQ